ncbi:hypothetical protein EJ03DRAFT_187587 [Teratosphaeria nubilosa]|uniref:Uncharacterized protein n=1 Tax=Teratosphaeria nubilosa TaxID=161662 RepID=A0A6G1LHW9_9PEZI|nr:hypothetical protein EJ03DRAFT_187587 [Teratosphaeria nubilosa]
MCGLSSKAALEKERRWWCLLLGGVETHLSRVRSAHVSDDESLNDVYILHFSRLITRRTLRTHLHLFHNRIDDPRLHLTSTSAPTQHKSIAGNFSGNNRHNGSAAKCLVQIHGPPAELNTPHKTGTRSGTTRALPPFTTHIGRHDARHRAQFTPHSHSRLASCHRQGFLCAGLSAGPLRKVSQYAPQQLERAITCQHLAKRDNAFVACLSQMLG